MAALSLLQAGPISYCGPPPIPASLAGRWNLDPVLIAALVLVAGWYLLKSQETPWRRAAFAAGWLTAAAALISPLCALGVALFSARVGQHMLLTALAAPLIALGRPDRLFARTAGAPILAAGAYAAALWFWHAPGPYAATFASPIVYWMMHLTTFGSALWLWTELVAGAGERLAGCAAAILITTVQMGLLGALLTFAAAPLFSPHALTTAAFGLKPLEDQQLGGVLMWVPAGLIFIGGLVLAFAEAMRRAAARTSLAG